MEQRLVGTCRSAVKPRLIIFLGWITWGLARSGSSLLLEGVVSVSIREHFAPQGLPPELKDKMKRLSARKSEAKMEAEPKSSFNFVNGYDLIIIKESSVTLVCQGWLAPVHASPLWAFLPSSMSSDVMSVA